MRHTNVSEVELREEMAEDYVNLFTTHAVPKAMSLVDIQEATKADNTLQSLTEMICIQTGEELKSPYMKEQIKSNCSYLNKSKENWQ